MHFIQQTGDFINKNMPFQRSVFFVPLNKGALTRPFYRQDREREGRELRPRKGTDKAKRS